jgi:predicted metal-binding membrane protein
MERHQTGAQPATLGPGGPTPACALRSGRLAVGGALLALAGVAWLATDLRMAGMDAGPGSDPGALGFFLSTWVVMMAAMMLPSIAPVVLAHRELQRRAAGQGQGGASALFVVGYLAVWGAAGLAGYAVLEAGRSLDGGLLAWGHGGRWAAAGVLAVAAVYELTPHKGACLTRCRASRAFPGESRRAGNLGALWMGVEHGAWCLGCCWALMAALFALGAMSLVWMVVISVLIAAEKLLPWRGVATLGVASLLAALAIGIGWAPARVPGLTAPGAMKAMRASGMAAPDGMRTGMPAAR